MCPRPCGTATSNGPLTFRPASCWVRPCCAGRACSPSKDQGSSGCRAGVATGPAASREVRCLPECCMRPAGRGIGSLLPPRASPFPTDTTRFVPFAVPRLLAQTGSSSRKLHAPSEFSHPVPAPRLPTWSAFQGVHFPSSRPQPAASLWRGPTRTTFRPRRFSRPRRFAPPLALRVYFTPQPRPGFTHEKIQLAQPGRLVTVPCPLVVGEGPLHRLPDAPRSLAPPSGLCSVREFRCPTTVFSRRRVLPLVGPPPPGLPSRRRRDAFTPLPLMAFIPGPSQSSP
jgi:hypothetical protein